MEAVPKNKVLHLDVPLMSTRRSISIDQCNTCNSNHNSDTTNTSPTIAFSWERAPGVPKHFLIDSSVTLKPPPDTCRSLSLLDEGRSFIMDRFLPAANALAESSVSAKLPPLYLEKRRRKQLTMLQMREIQDGCCNHSNVKGDTQRFELPTKACGFVLLVPCGSSGNKAIICGLKSPIRKQSALKVSGLRGPIMKEECDDGVSSKAWRSPGWGLPFLDAGKLLRRKENRVERGRRTLPRLETPTEPWLGNALNSVSRRPH